MSTDLERVATLEMVDPINTVAMLTLRRPMAEAVANAVDPARSRLWSFERGTGSPGVNLRMTGVGQKKLNTQIAFPRQRHPIARKNGCESPGRKERLPSL